MNFEIDVRSVLPSIRVPTLVLVRDGDTPVEIDAGTSPNTSRAPATRSCPATTTSRGSGINGRSSEEIQRFVRDVRDEEAELDRVLATVLFTDIVGSTEKAADLGDRRLARSCLEDHDARVRGTAHALPGPRG